MVEAASSRTVVSRNTMAVCGSACSEPEWIDGLLLDAGQR
eukprot:jgi/Hompol1/551/HPOL_000369-RA